MQKPPKDNNRPDDVTIVAPDYSLKQAVGDADLKQIFSAENIEKAQAVIEQHTSQFTDWVKSDLNTLESLYEQAAAAPQSNEDTIQKLAKTAFIIKSQAGTFGFMLATQVAKSLDDFCNRDYRACAEHLTVIRKHIDALQTIFQHSIKGDGKDAGADLLSTLQKLVAKYRRTA